MTSEHAILEILQLLTNLRAFYAIAEYLRCPSQVHILFDRFPLLCRRLRSCLVRAVAIFWLRSCGSGRHATRSLSYRAFLRAQTVHRRAVALRLRKRYFCGISQFRAAHARMRFCMCVYSTTCSFTHCIKRSQASERGPPFRVMSPR